MLSVCWSPKGGSGTSVVAAALAAQSATSGMSTVIVDLVGDQSVVLGVEVGERDGVAEWIVAGDDVSAEAVRNLEVKVAPELSLVPLGRGRVDGSSPRTIERLALMAAVHEAGSRHVVVDAGVRRPGPAWWPAGASSVVVTRLCFLGLRRLRAIGIEPGDRLVLVEETGRSLNRHDVTEAFGPVAAALSWDSAVARAVDAGVLVGRMPRALRPLRALLPARVAA